MPRTRKTSPETEESTVSTSELETTIAAEEQGEDIDSIMSALRAEIAEKQKKVRELKGQKPARERKPKAEKAPKAAKSLDEVIAAQAAAPRASAVSRFVRAAHARVAAGQPIHEAVQGVMEQYAAIVLEVLSAMDSEKLSGRDAVIRHFETNFPSVSSGRKRSRKAAEPTDESDSSDEEESYDESDEDEEEDDED